VKPSRLAACPRRGLKHEEAALYIGISVSTFDRLRAAGRMPGPNPIGVWDISKLDRAFDLLSDSSDEEILAQVG
jgi:predicted DNA-binding transcriptional regulator AlpA